MRFCQGTKLYIEKEWEKVSICSCNSLNIKKHIHILLEKHNICQNEIEKHRTHVTASCLIRVLPIWHQFLFCWSSYQLLYNKAIWSADIDISHEIYSVKFWIVIPGVSASRGVILNNKYLWYTKIGNDGLLLKLLMSYTALYKLMMYGLTLYTLSTQTWV